MLEHVRQQYTPAKILIACLRRVYNAQTTLKEKINISYFLFFSLTGSKGLFVNDVSCGRAKLAVRNVPIETSSSVHVLPPCPLLLDVCPTFSISFSMLSLIKEQNVSGQSKFGKQGF